MTGRSKRVAAIDCGTNSIRLLIADSDGNGGLEDKLRLMEVVRLGQGVDKTGVLSEQALERTFKMSRKYKQLCDEYEVEQVRFVATSATRDAENREVFQTGIKEIFEVSPEVVTGEEEAKLSFSGALRTVKGKVPGPFLVVDLGGGSTELVLGENEPTAAYSMNMGCVRVTERYLGWGQVTDQAVGDAVTGINNAITEAFQQVPVKHCRAVVGLAGSVTTITAHALKMDSYQRELINGAEVSLEQMSNSSLELLFNNREERANYGFMHPGRVDVIGGGALVWKVLLDRVAQEVAKAGGELTHTVTSEHDILDGIALSIG